MINTPQEDIVLPEDVKRGIERARNSITVMEAEYERLKGLVVSQQYTVGEAHKELTELESKTAHTKKTLEEGESARVLLMNELEELRSRKESYDKEYLVRESSLKEREGVSDERERALKNREEEIEVAKQSVSDAMCALELREKSVQEKEDQIKTFVLSL